MANELKHFWVVWVNAVCGIRAEIKAEETKEEEAEDEKLNKKSCV